jgi:hypothetical protein
VIVMMPQCLQLRVSEGTRRRLGGLAVLVVLLTGVSGCSGEAKETDSRSTPVCDGKLIGSVFQDLVGSGGVTSEETKRFQPKKWTAFGYCFLYGKDESAEIDYLWHSSAGGDLKSVQSPSPSTAGTFNVGSAVGYIEKSRVRVVMPCTFPGAPASTDYLLEIEVKDMPPLQTFDSDLSKSFVSAAKIAARYLGGEVFNCPAVGSGPATGSTFPSPSNT